MLRTLLAVALVALQDGTLVIVELQINSQAPVRGMQCVVAGAGLFHVPILKPYMIGVRLRAGQASGAARITLNGVKFISRHIGKGKMGQVNLAGGPIAIARNYLVRWQKGRAEEGKLKTKMAALRSVQVSGVIPPLSVVIGVRAKILRETECKRPIPRVKAPRSAVGARVGTSEASGEDAGLQAASRKINQKPEPSNLRKLVKAHGLRGAAPAGTEGGI